MKKGVGDSAERSELPSVGIRISPPIIIPLIE